MSKTNRNRSKPHRQSRRHKTLHKRGGGRRIGRSSRGRKLASTIGVSKGRRPVEKLRGGHLSNSDITRLEKIVEELDDAGLNLTCFGKSISVEDFKETIRSQEYTNDNIQQAAETLFGDDGLFDYMFQHHNDIFNP